MKVIFISIILFVLCQLSFGDAGSEWVTYLESHLNNEERKYVKTSIEHPNLRCIIDYADLSIILPATTTSKNIKLRKIITT